MKPVHGRVEPLRMCGRAPGPKIQAIILSVGLVRGRVGSPRYPRALHPPMGWPSPLGGVAQPSLQEVESCSVSRSPSSMGEGLASIDC